MSGNPLTPLWILLGLVILFIVVIWVNLRFRKATFAANLDLRARDVWESLGSPNGNFSDLLYGVLQDFSATELGLLVRDCNDKEVGRVAFHAGARQAWITLESGGETFQGDVLTTFRQSVALHRAADSSRPICTFHRMPRGIFRFDVEGIGGLESKPPRGLHIAPLYEYTINGQTVGASQHIGGWINRGNCLLLPAKIPIPIRIFILAMQRQRM